MAIKTNLEVTRQDKKLMIGAAALLLLAVALFLSLSSLVDVKVIQSQLKTIVKQATGLDIEVQDGIEVNILPYPHVKMKNLYISNLPGASTSFLLSIRSMDVRLRPTSLFTSHPSADSITVDGVVVELEKLKNGHLNWEEMAHYVAASAEHSASNVAEVVTDPKSDIGNISLVFAELSKVSNFTVSNAEIHFTDSQYNIVSDYSNIRMQLTNDARNNKSILNASVNYGDFPLGFNAEMEEIGQVYEKKNTQLKIRFESEQTFLNYEGSVNFVDNLDLKGKSSFESKNITRWMQLLNGADFTNDKTVATTKAVPLTLSSEVSTQGKRIMFPEIAVGGGVFAGKLQAALKLPLTWEIKGNLDDVDLDTVLASGIFSSGKSDKKDPLENADAPASLNLAVKKSMWNYLTFAVDLRATNMDYNHNHIKNGHLEFDMSDGDVAISQASGKFPGESKLLFTGLGKEGYQGFMVDGQLDGSGDNFNEMASIFAQNGSSITLPSDFKRFRFKTNMVLSAKELRFTELTSRIENMAFVGGIITTIGERTKIQAAMRMGGIDADHLYTLWGGEKLRQKLMTENVNSSVKIEDDFTPWLRNLSYDLDMRASVEKFILNGATRDKCKFRLSAIKNKLTLTELEMGYNDTQLAGKIFFDVTEASPFADIDITADTVDITAYTTDENWLIDPVDAHSEKTEGRNWSHKGLDFQWLETFNSSFRFRLGQLKNHGFEATAIDLKGGVQNRTLSLSSFNGIMQNAQIAGKGFIKGGKIPSASVVFDVSGFDASNLSGVLPAIDGMSGKYNIHSRLTTSGIDVYTWIYNMDGAIAIASRNVKVDGFNLPGIINAVGYVRTVADILDVVKRAFPGGSTEFSTIEGEWGVGSGILKTPALKLGNDMSEGLFSGEVDLINWKMVGHLVLSLSFLDRVTPPKLAINYTGSLDNIEKELDTRLLEQYVANKTSEKLLQRQ